MFRRTRQGGFYLIGLLLVLIIIVYLTYEGYFSSSQGNPSTYQNTMNKTRAVDCTATRTTLKTYLIQWQIKNPGQTPTLDDLYASGAPRNKCLDRGVYTISKDGEVYCSKHNPDPSQSAAP